MPCLDEDRLLEYLSHSLDETSARDVEDHLGDCGSCRELVAEAIRVRSILGAPSAGPVDAASTPLSGAAPSSTGWLDVGARVDRYFILHALGAGSMGQAYAAFDPKLDRRVCLKLLHPHRVERDVMLVREAQAMARLMHPNVAAVHDTGAHDGRLFVAMELVDGTTLSVWLGQKPRAPREILQAFAQAGEGLAAAHEAGLVHRDFKPDNVLVDRSGRVKVVDFGLAAVVDREGAAKEVAGTPFYMSPEQKRGDAADARSDQYSFCLSLREALRGTANAKAQVFLARRLQRLLARGLSEKPEDRYPSMRALLKALTKPVPWRSPAAWAAAAALASVAVAIALVQPVLRRGCDAADQRARVWNPERAAALAQSFEASGIPFAKEASDAIARGFDAWARAFDEEAQGLCRRTRTLRESPELLALERSCLDESLAHAGTLLGLLAKPDAELVRTSAAAVPTEASVRTCADAKAIARRRPVPADPRLREPVESLRAQLAEARAALDLGQARKERARLEKLKADAEAIAFRPIQAEALELLGRGLSDLAEYEPAQATWKEAARRARAGGHDALEASAWSNLVSLQGFTLQRFGEGHESERFARAVLERLNGDDGIEASLEAAVAAMLYREEKLGEAERSARRAVALAERVFGADHPEVARRLGVLAKTRHLQGHLDEALEIAQRAYKAVRGRLGPHHPLSVRVLNDLAGFQFDKGDLAAAESSVREVLATREQLEGAHHPQVARMRTNHGQVLEKLGRLDEAIREHRQAVDDLEAGFGAEHAEVARALLNLSVVHLLKREAPQALPAIQRAVAIREKSFGEAHPDTAEALAVRAQVLNALDRRREALADTRRSLAILEKALGPDHPRLRESLVVQGSLLLALEGPAAALPSLERAWKVSQEASPDERAQFDLSLAKALWLEGSPASRKRALSLAADGERELAALSYRHADLQALADWVRAHVSESSP